MTGDPSRRSFLKTSATAGAAAATLTSALPARAYADEDNTIQLALVGCGGRGTGAATNALSVDSPLKMVAMADVFESNLKNSHGNLAQNFSENGRLDVADENRYIGFDAYKKAMDVLRPGDIVMWDALITTGVGVLQTTDVVVVDDDGLIDHHVLGNRGYWGR